jgi:hypothetical protein
VTSTVRLLLDDHPATPGAPCARVAKTGARDGRAACRQMEDPRGPASGDDPLLRELARCAHDLIAALRRGGSADQLQAELSAYGRAARQMGVRGERLHDALELLVHEHAREAGDEAASVVLLRGMLTLVDPDFRPGACPHDRPVDAGRLPHWCRIHGHGP